jgi:hypothetical protein
MTNLEQSVLAVAQRRPVWSVLMIAYQLNYPPQDVKDALDRLVKTGRLQSTLQST